MSVVVSGANGAAGWVEGKRSKGPKLKGGFHGVGERLRRGEHRKG